MKMMKRRFWIMLGGLLGITCFLVLVNLDTNTAWAQRFGQIRLLAILNTAGTDQVILQQDSSVGIPVAIISGGNSTPIWVASQNPGVLAQCAVSSTALATATSKQVTIKASDLNTDNVWCTVGGTPDVNVGFRVGQASEGIGIGISDPADIACCGEGAATFRISVTVEN